LQSGFCSALAIRRCGTSSGESNFAPVKIKEDATVKKIRLFVLGCMVALGFSAVPNAFAGPEGRCKMCHDFGTKHMVGPGLKGVVGRKAGSTDFGRYSAGLKAGGWVWDEDHLRKWIDDSTKAIQEFSGDANAKTSMPPQRVKGAQADAIIEFLKGLK